MKKLVTAAALAACAPLAAAQTPAKPQPLPTKEAAKPAPTGPLATVNGVAIPRQRAEMLAQQRIAQGAADSEQLRAMIREELINRELILQEANRSGFAKRADVQQEAEFVRQSVIVQAYLRDWVRQHPVTDAEVQKEYERVKQQTGTTEYRARHILVGSEDEAKKLLAELRGGAKFEDLAAKHSLDEGTRVRGGDLDWSVPATFDREFANAMVKLEKGATTSAPVRTRFGFHIIRLDDVRPVNFPPLAQVRPQIEQRLVQQKVETLVREMRAKAKIE
ncbi:MAG: peptidylprolyl isomerase [Burkholderiales bacterium]|nr:peptidylprolyl isomerase [Burkholderiales bacterium]